MRLENFFVLLGLVSLASGCGTVVPPIDYAYDNVYSNGIFVNAVARHVNCEIGNAVKDAYQAGEPDWLRDWAAKVTLDLTVDEKTALNPGVALSNTPQTLGLGLGGKVTASAERQQTMTWFVVFADYFPPVRRHVARNELAGKLDCTADKPVALKGNLQIAETLLSATYVAPMDTIAHPYKTGGPYDDIVHHVNFEIDLEGGINPTWKFVNVSSDSTELLGVSRNRKDDLLITMGPAVITKEGRKLVAYPTTRLESVHDIGRLGQAVSSALQGQK